MFDTHVHTTFSHDGKSNPIEYKALIDENIVKAIGFTEHVEYFPESTGFGRFDYKGYKNAISELKSQGYPFYAGAEVGYLSFRENEVLTSLRKESYDFIIGSVHRSKGYSLSTDKSVDVFHDYDLFREILENYYSDVTKSLDIDGFDVIGHIGIYKRHLKDDFYIGKTSISWINEVENELAKQCAGTDKIIEVNSSGLFTTSNTTFPNQNFLKYYYKYGGRRVCMGSDAHSTSKVARGFDFVKEMLSNIGFKYIYLPWDKEKGVKF